MAQYSQTAKLRDHVIVAQALKVSYIVKEDLTDDDITLLDRMVAGLLPLLQVMGIEQMSIRGII